MAITPYSDLPPEECARRLGASGWAGTPNPRRLQPTAGNRDILRVIRGRTFQLWSRAATFPGDTSSPFPQAFHGRLQPQGGGTSVRGYYGASRRMKVGIAVGIFLPTLALLSIENHYDFRGHGSVPWPSLALTTLVLAGLLFALYWAMDRRARRYAATGEAYFAAFLTETLEARPAATTDTRDPSRAAPTPTGDTPGSQE